MPSNYTPTHDALSNLYRHGAHFVLCNPDKLPIHKWLHRPSLDRTIAHTAKDGLVGIIPASVGCSVADVDSGNPQSLTTNHPPLINVPTRRKNGHHLWYPDPVARRNSNWSAYGCSGEIRSGRGYAILWKNAAGLIADTLTNWPSHPVVPFPVDVFQPPLPGLEIGVRTLSEGYTDIGIVTLPVSRLLSVTDKALENVPVGARNVSLFLVIREWAFNQTLAVRKGNSDTFHVIVEHYALEQNVRFQVPLSSREVRDIAHSVSQYEHRKAITFSKMQSARVSQRWAKYK